MPGSVPLTEAQGDFTIVDFNDATVLQAAIDFTTGVPNQIYRTDSANYNTGNDWTTTNLVLLPRLYKSGTPPVETCADNATYTVTVKWYHNTSGSWVLINSDQVTLSDTTNFAWVSTAVAGQYARFGIKVKGNILGVQSKSAQIKAEITYTDPISTLSSTSIAFFDVSVFATQKGAVALFIDTNNGFQFKNGALNQSDTITLTATLMRGSTADTTNLAYVWKQDGVTISGATAPSYTVSASQVFGDSLFSCTVTDSIEGDTYSNNVRITDLMDPIDVVISSSKGDKFNAGDATIVTTLTANLYQSGTPIANPSGSGFLWTLLNKDGSAGDWVSGTDATPDQGTYTTGALTGSGALNANYLTGLTLTNIRIGHTVTGTGVPAGTKVNKIDTVVVPNRVYLTKSLTAAGSSYTFSLAANEKVTATNQTTVSAADITIKGTILCKVLF